MAFPNLAWNHLLDAALLECIQNRRLNFAASGHPPTRAGHEAFLTALGITPSDCFQFTGVAPANLGPLPVPPAQNAPVPKVLLKAQEVHESMEDFLARAADYMRISNLNDAHQILALQNALQPGPALAVHTLLAEGNATYATITTSLQTRYATPKFVTLDQYHSIQRQANESLCSFAQRLRTLFCRFLGIPFAGLAIHEPVIKQVLVARILPSVPPNVRMQAQALFEASPDLALDVFLARVDGFFSYNPSSSVHRRHDQQPLRSSRASTSTKWCSNHNSPTHWTSDCTITKRQSVPQSTSSTGDRSAAGSRNKNNRWPTSSGSSNYPVCAAVEESNLSSQSENEN